jgi:hypothetical protein
MNKLSANLNMENLIGMNNLQIHLKSDSQLAIANNFSLTKEIQLTKLNKIFPFSQYSTEEVLYNKEIYKE